MFVVMINFPLYKASGLSHYPSLRAIANGGSLGENSDLAFCRFSCLAGSSPTVSHSR